MQAEALACDDDSDDDSVMMIEGSVGRFLVHFRAHKFDLALSSVMSRETHL